MLDIREGDLLVVGNNSYPVRSVAEWDRFPVSRAFMRLASMPCKIQRETFSGGRTLPHSDWLTGLRCLPVDPVDPELRDRLMIDTPHELKQTAVADDTGFLVLVVEDAKTR